MKKTKRIIPALILSLVMMVLVTACGSNAPIAEKDGDSSSVQPADAAGENTTPMTTKLLPSKGRVVLAEYNAKGQKIAETTKNFMGNTPSTTTFEYDEHGNIIKQVSQYIYVHTYDTTGNRVETTVYAPDGTTVYFIEKHECDNDRNITKTTTYEANGVTVVDISVYEYDELGNQIKSTCYKADGITESRISNYEYDDQGNLTGEYYKSDFFQSRYEYQYDSDNNFIAQTEYKDDLKEVEYHYFPNGEVSREASYLDGELNMDIQYDENGNGIKKSVYLNGISPVETTYDPQTRIEEWGSADTGKTISEFDQNGILIRREYYHPDGILAAEDIFDENGTPVYAQRYDKSGNPTDKKNHNENGPIKRRDW